MQRFLSALPIRWALLLVTGLWSILAVAQSTCPELKVSDFKVNYYAANADCGTAGQIIVTYRNNVAGFSNLDRWRNMGQSRGADQSVHTHHHSSHRLGGGANHPPACHGHLSLRHAGSDVLPAPAPLRTAPRGGAGV